MTRRFVLRDGFLAVLALFVLLALVIPSDHDEGQYVAAAHFVAEGLRPYRDFPYLQTPLQPFLTAPLAWLAPGWLFLAIRLANALAMALAALLLARTAIDVSGRRVAGGLTLAGVASVDAVQFGASVARNDALPMLFFAAAITLLFARGRVTKRRAFAAGLMLALAASTKVSYALPAAAAGAMALWHASRAHRPEVAALLGGLFVGGMPILWFLATDTQRFIFFAYRYSVDAVLAWQSYNGSIDALGWPKRLRRFVTFLALGPTLVLLIAVLFTRRRDAPEREAPPLGIKPGILLGASLIAAILPMPSYRQYIVPIIPPLVLVIALRGEELLGRLRQHRLRAGLAIGLLLITSLAGSARSLWAVLDGAPARRPIAIEREAHRLGRWAQSGRVIGLDPLLLVDSGLDFDPRFATGPFLFRAGNLPACADPSLCGVTFAHLDRLDRAPPGLVLTGTERRSPRGLKGGLDGFLDSWARRHGYRPQHLGDQILWIAPR